MKTWKPLIQALSDGRFHSGESLGNVLGITRAGVWKRIQQLQAVGLRIHSVKGKGYRLVDKIELFSTQEVLAYIDAANALSSLSIHETIDSTNAYLLNQAGNIATPAACLAETQTAGRGRRGKPWLSPFGSNIYASLLWVTPKGAQSLEGLSLMVGVSVAEALARVGCTKTTLKWPNDIYAEGKKLGGILVELNGPLMDQAQVVIGIGLNLALTQSQREQIDQPVIDLTELGWNGQRNQLAGIVFDQLLKDLVLFEKRGFAAFQEAWNQRNAFKNQAIEIIQPRSRLIGQCGPVNAQGELMLQTEQGELRIHSGEVSLRRSATALQNLQEHKTSR
jgi:BirA family biotin operon repressor/biotin-[acetyl-CoA-carboxylase] ligase